MGWMDGVGYLAACQEMFQTAGDLVKDQNLLNGEGVQRFGPQVHLRGLEVVNLAVRVLIGP